MLDERYEDAMKFLALLKERMPEWSYDNYDAEIEYIQDMIWQYNYLKNGN